MNLRGIRYDIPNIIVLKIFEHKGAINMSKISLMIVV